MKIPACCECIAENIDCRSLNGSPSCRNFHKMLKEKFTKVIICPCCYGEGRISDCDTGGTKQCPHCDGVGKIIAPEIIDMLKCEVCGSKKVNIIHKCKDCESPIDVSNWRDRTR